MLLACAVLAAVATTAAWAASGGGEDSALTASRFSITIDGYEIASFAELAGIVSEIEPATVESTGKSIEASRPTNRPPTITLRRGMSSNMEIYAWHQAARQSFPDARKNANLVMYDVEGKPVARFYLENAWPARVEVSGLKAGASEVLMESVTFVSELVQRVAP